MKYFFQAIIGGLLLQALLIGPLYLHMNGGWSHRKLQFIDRCCLLVLICIVVWFVFELAAVILPTLLADRMRRKTELAFKLQSIDDLALNLYLLILRLQFLVRLLLQLLLLQEQLRIFSVVILMFLFLLLILLFKGLRSGAKILIAAPVISFLRVFVLVEAV